jgi:PD-(D/E)XK nuclease superfamily
LKAKEKLVSAHEAQLTNYVRATDIEVGLLFNFGKIPEFKRKYFSNKNKSLRHTAFHQHLRQSADARSVRIRLIR